MHDCPQGVTAVPASLYLMDDDAYGGRDCTSPRLVLLLRLGRAACLLGLDGAWLDRLPAESSIRIVASVCQCAAGRALEGLGGHWWWPGLVCKCACNALWYIYRHGCTLFFTLGNGQCRSGFPSGSTQGPMVGTFWRILVPWGMTCSSPCSSLRVVANMLVVLLDVLLTDWVARRWPLLGSSSTGMGICGRRHWHPVLSVIVLWWTSSWKLSSGAMACSSRQAPNLWPFVQADRAGV
mmetsp:Transcript_12440/g.35369  ORF Transcript_12440/g.35369 Transcript_12440/m.35369 type:complete len:237 (-) Transcript_12440:40-750(-)